MKSNTDVGGGFGMAPIIRSTIIFNSTMFIADHEKTLSET